MASKRALSFIFPLYAFLIVTGCSGSGGGNDNPPPPSADADDGGNHIPPDDASSGNELPLAENLAEIFPNAPASNSGLLKDNIAGVWLITGESISRGIEGTTRGVGREILYILPNTIVESGASEPLYPNSIAAPLQDCSNWDKYIVLPKDPAATQATIYVGDVGPSELKIISDTRMESETSDSKTVWQKIAAPVDENGKPVLGSISYQFSGTESVSGSADIHCLAQGASSVTGGGRDPRDTPLTVGHLQLRFDNPQRSGEFELTINNGDAIDQLSAVVFDKTGSESASDIFTTAQDADIADDITSQTTLL